MEPVDNQTFPAGAAITIRWWREKPLDPGQRYRVALRGQDGTSIEQMTAGQEIQLTDLAPGGYTWLVLVEERREDMWQEVSRSPRWTFAIQASATPIVGPSGTPIPTPEPTDTATPEPTGTPTPVATQTETPQQTPPSADAEQGDAPARPGGGSLGGKLAFSLVQGTNFKVYVVEVGPTAPDKPYSSVGSARQPDLSPDGKWLLFNGTGHGGPDAIARSTSEGQQVKVVTCPDSTSESGRPVWSPDGASFAFDGLDADPANPPIYIQRVDEQPCDLVNYRLRVNGGNTSDPNGLMPVWGPDDRIYFRSCATWDAAGGSQCGVWSCQRDGGDPLRIVDSANHIPTDANSERLLYMSAESGNWEVYSVGLQGGSPQNLTNNPSATDVWGTLSPDGRSMAFLSNREGGWAVWLADIDGSDAHSWLPINPDWGEIDPDRLAQERMSWSP